VAVKGDAQSGFIFCVEGNRNLTTEELCVALGAEAVSSRLLNNTLLSYIAN
jgi:hypothetical protein